MFKLLPPKVSRGAAGGGGGVYPEILIFFEENLVIFTISPYLHAKSPSPLFLGNNIGLFRLVTLVLKEAVLC